MLGNFSYCNPTKLYFGSESLNYLNNELPKYGKNVLLVYGGGSIKKNGIYDEIINILKINNKNIFEDYGVMPNPTIEKLYEGCRRLLDAKADLILAVGGGSVVDYAKALSVSAYSKEDPWQKYYIEFKEPDNKIVPVGVVLTMVGTGSEMNGGAVITNPKENLKIGHVFGEDVFPKFAILNPKYTYSVPHYQMIAGIFDTMSHILEQYLSGDDDNTSDYIMEGLMRSLIHSSLIAVKEPENYEARSNIMWIATWALNTLVAKGKPTDWEVHMIGQAIGAVTNATHGMTLSAVSIPYYKLIMPYGLKQFAKLGRNVFNIAKKDDNEAAKLAIDSLNKWMKEIGVVLNISELGVTRTMFDKIVSATFLNEGGYKKLTKEDVYAILEASL